MKYSLGRMCLDGFWFCETCWQVYLQPKTTPMFECGRCGKRVSWEPPMPPVSEHAVGVLKLLRKISTLGRPRASLKLRWLRELNLRLPHLELEPPIPKNCCWHDWVETLEDESDGWIIRDTKRGVAWRNQQMRLLAGEDQRPPHIAVWEDVAQTIATDSRVAVEDCVSRVLKSGKAQEVPAKLRFAPQKAVKLSAFPVECSRGHCESCPFVVLHVEPQ